MLRAVVVLVTTFLFACFGAAAGYLSINGILLQGSGRGITSDDVIIAYAVKPLVAGLIGFAMAVFTLKMFAGK